MVSVSKYVCRVVNKYVCRVINKYSKWIFLQLSGKNHLFFLGHFILFTFIVQWETGNNLVELEIWHFVVAKIDHVGKALAVHSGSFNFLPKKALRPAL